MPEYKMKVTRQVTEITEVTVKAENADDARNMAENGIVLSVTSVSGPEETRTVDEGSIKRLPATGEVPNPTGLYEAAMSDLRDDLEKIGEELAEVFAERKEAAAVDYEWDAPCVMARLDVAVAYDGQTPLSGKPASVQESFAVIYDTEASEVLLFWSKGDDLYFQGKSDIPRSAERLAEVICEHLDLKAMDLAINAPEYPLKLTRAVEMATPLQDVRADIEYDVQGIWTGVTNIEILGEYGPKSSGMTL